MHHQHRIIPVVHPCSHCTSFEKQLQLWIHRVALPTLIAELYTVLFSHRVFLARCSMNIALQALIVFYCKVRAYQLVAAVVIFSGLLRLWRIKREPEHSYSRQLHLLYRSLLLSDRHQTSCTFLNLQGLPVQTMICLNRIQTMNSLMWHLGR